MSRLELITLVLGLLVVISLSYLYLRYRISRVVLKQFVLHGDKSIKRAYYILTHHHYHIEQFNRNFYFNILFDNKIIKNKFSVVAVARKENKRYLCFIDAFLVSDFNMNYEVLFKMQVSGFRRGLLVNTNDFSLQEVRIISGT